ncbi:chemotaxis protein CheY [Microbacterium testaceum]|uniref:Chemotaxis protein CheY n=1 Tax=Microbacterium testaceum TaxID=2033 RepID=A0A147F5R2_MICTE|nr:chemotaxis protein CheY [Microbacterium testaceum]KTS09771.1 chemotaxis protein CheY [Microbacterium testaceum]KTS64636.1 chemotaxis protein CheY [Microbacterium testaceum]KTS90807.1 chemotaxis protein CheY [Microbacterium testaceum]
MPERVSERVRRLLVEQPSIDVRFTAAIAPESFHHAVRPSGAVLFLHPVHRDLVEQLRGG